MKCSGSRARRRRVCASCPCATTSLRFEGTSRERDVPQPLRGVASPPCCPQCHPSARSGRPTQCHAQEPSRAQDPSPPGQTLPSSSRPCLHHHCRLCPTTSPRSEEARCRAVVCASCAKNHEEPRRPPCTTRRRSFRGLALPRVRMLRSGLRGELEPRDRPP